MQPHSPSTIRLAPGAALNNLLGTHICSGSKPQTDLQTVHDRVVAFFFLPFEIDYAIAYETCGVPKELDLVTQVEVDNPIRIAEGGYVRA
jgi:hypothetical protein